MRKSIIRIVSKGWNKDFNQKCNVAKITHWKTIAEKSVYRPIKVKITIEEIL